LTHSSHNRPRTTTWSANGKRSNPYFVRFRRSPSAGLLRFVPITRDIWAKIIDPERRVKSRERFASLELYGAGHQRELKGFGSNT
jgi:hypothetical protein